MSILQFRNGTPDQAGWWWLLPNKEWLNKTGNFLPDGPSIVEVRMYGDVIPQKPELMMRGHEGRLEAYLFEGKVSGPIPEPKNGEMALSQFAELVEGKDCCVCHQQLSLPIKVEFYPHSDGWRMSGFSERQWLFVVCTNKVGRKKCNFQNSFEVLGIKK